MPNGNGLEELWRRGRIFVGLIVGTVVVTLGISSYLEGGRSDMMRRIAELELQVQSRTESRFTRANMVEWCLRTEAANPDWKCAEVPKWVPE